MSDKFTPSNDVVVKVQEFEEADAQYSKTWTDFEEKAAEWFKMLDSMRELRNRRLDEATRAVREEAVRTKSSFRLGAFKVDHKTKRYFTPEEFCKVAGQFNILDQLKAAGAVQVETSIDTEKAAEWLKTNDYVSKFIPTYREEPMTPAVSGPKEVPPFGAPAKAKGK